MLRNRWIRWLVFWPVLIVSGFHTLLTGSPIPLWHLENLHSPIPVRSVTETAIVLEDGQQVSLPFISKLPRHDPVLQAAINQGVEVGRDNEVWGLVWISKDLRQ